MRQGSNAGATLTDEQILEMEPEGAGGSGESDSSTGYGAGAGTGSGTASSQNARRSDESILDDEGDGRGANGIADEAGERFGDAARNAKSSGQSGDSNGAQKREQGETARERAERGAADEPAWLASLAAQPEAAAEAHRWHAAAKDVASIDAAYFSADAGARVELATRLYESDPGAFRSMLAASARTLAARDPEGMAELARQLGMPEEAARSSGKSVSQAARAAVRDTPAARDANNSARNGEVDRGTPPANQNGQRVFPAESYRAFEASTNEEVARQMHEAIDRSLRSTLPEGIAQGARRRIGEDIFREVHASLASDRELAGRVGETLRDWRFDSAARQQVAGMVAGRGRAMLPEVARRVVAEWTSSVLASDRAKTARIDAATARRDVTGGRLPEPVAGSGRPRKVDYGRMSDEQILEL